MYIDSFWAAGEFDFFQHFPKDFLRPYGLATTEASGTEDFSNGNETGKGEEMKDEVNPVILVEALNRVFRVFARKYHSVGHSLIDCLNH
ncbi:unnamed protein product [Clavelina lepadiformis]|uniref:Uncharacterized protein n=1 Tax=Clavelina lepadiformis TaxID=159417 RepID=A0ABP0G4M2_CLALP